MNMYLGVSKSISVRGSEQDVYGTKLDRIEETISKLGESTKKDDVIQKTKKSTNGDKLKKNKC